ADPSDARMPFEVICAAPARRLSTNTACEQLPACTVRDGVENARASGCGRAFVVAALKATAGTAIVRRQPRRVVRGRIERGVSTAGQFITRQIGGAQEEAA